MLNEGRLVEKGTLENTDSGRYTKQKEPEEQSEVEERKSPKPREKNFQ